MPFVSENVSFSTASAVNAVSATVQNKHLTYLLLDEWACVQVCGWLVSWWTCVSCGSLKI